MEKAPRRGNFLSSLSSEVRDRFIDANPHLYYPRRKIVAPGKVDRETVVETHFGMES